MESFIPLSVPNLSGNELEYVTKAVQTEWVSTGGKFIQEFEQAVAKYASVPDAVACQSGTAGLHLALRVCGVKAGDEVLVPTLTFVAAVNPVRYVGAYPVFLDCDDTLTLDPDKAEDFCETQCRYEGGRLINKTTGRPVTAIMCVHVFGNLANLDRLAALAKKYGLLLIEDATEALGSRYLSGEFSGRMAGTIGDAGVYSFNGNKIITTGGGGMIVSQNQKILERCRHLSTQAKEDPVYFVHDEIGYNYRMTNLQAALGLAQLEQLEGFIQIKKKNYERYQALGISLLPFRQDIRPNFWFYSLMTDHRDEMISFLQEKKIQTRPVWQLIHTLAPYREQQAYCIERAVYYHQKIVNIPCSTNLKEEEVGRVASAIKEQEQGA